MTPLPTSELPLPVPTMTHFTNAYIDGLVQEKRNSIANTLVLRFSCTNPSICITGLNELISQYISAKA